MIQRETFQGNIREITKRVSERMRAVLPTTDSLTHGLIRSLTPGIPVVTFSASDTETELEPTFPETDRVTEAAVIFLRSGKTPKKHDVLFERGDLRGADNVLFID